jgi:NAD(P)-dependent dehydrogenase (short-subunit alcohol dehydrogenase family)
MQDLAGSTALVTGASRGFGRAIATALSNSGAQVVGLARDASKLDELRAELGEPFIAQGADASDPVVAGQLIDRYRPRVLVLNAGATGVMRPIHYQSWETFSRYWEVDVKQVFHWVREALLRPLDPGSVVIALSSRAALMGAPVVGGYAGAKATIRFITAYAAAESERAGLGITFRSVLPMLTPHTELGAYAVAGFAKQQRVEVSTFVERLGPPLTPPHVASAVLDLATGTSYDQDAYFVTAAGLTPLG